MHPRGCRDLGWEMQWEGGSGHEHVLAQGPRLGTRVLRPCRARALCPLLAAGLSVGLHAGTARSPLGSPGSSQPSSPRAAVLRSTHGISQCSGVPPRRSQAGAPSLGEAPELPGDEAACPAHPGAELMFWGAQGAAGSGLPCRPCCASPPLAPRYRGHLHGEIFSSKP